SSLAFVASSSCCAADLAAQSSGLGRPSCLHLEEIERFPESFLRELPTLRLPQCGKASEQEPAHEAITSAFAECRKVEADLTPVLEAAARRDLKRLLSGRERSGREVGERSPRRWPKRMPVAERQEHRGCDTDAAAFAVGRFERLRDELGKFGLVDAEVDSEFHAP